MQLRYGHMGPPTQLMAGDMMIYKDRRLILVRDGKRLFFAGGTFDTFLVPQNDDGFGLASVMSYVTGLDFETREYRGVRAFLFKNRIPQPYEETQRRLTDATRTPLLNLTV